MLSWRLVQNVGKPRNDQSELGAELVQIPENLDAERPVLIAGPTASGKSALALEIAARDGGVIVNADALQVFANWRVLTARPSQEEEYQAPHHLYGHISADSEYSVGHWLREIADLMTGDQRLIIVGGTGLYFSALTEGLAEIPPTAPEIRKQADVMRTQGGLDEMRAALDTQTRARVDLLNPMRVQRAWEVLQTTGRGLADWQDNTPPPLIALDHAQPILLNADRDWLAERIDRRFAIMMNSGALEEAKANLDTWNPSKLSSKAIGAPELIAHLQGQLTLEDAIRDAQTATRQFAKRQRTWFRSRMKSWTPLNLPL